MKWGFKYPCYENIECDAIIQNWVNISYLGRRIKAEKTNANYIWIKPFYELKATIIGRYSIIRIVTIVTPDLEILWSRSERIEFREIKPLESHLVISKNRIAGKDSLVDGLTTNIPKGTSIKMEFYYSGFDQLK